MEQHRAMSMHAYARRLLQEVAVAVPPASPAPSPADSGDQRPASSISASSSGNSPFNVSSQFSPAMIIILVILLSAFFFMGFFAIYVRRCTSEENFSHHGNTRAGTSRRHNGTAGLQRGLGVDPSLVESFPMVSYAVAKRKGCNECVVCLADFEREEELKQLPKCKHVFHLECIGVWLESHTTCPLCRRSLVNSDRWSVSWRWGGSSRGSARLNEGESSHSSRGGNPFLGGPIGSSRGSRIRVPSRNGNESLHAQEEGELVRSGSLYASPDPTIEMALPGSAPPALFVGSSTALEIVAEDLNAGNTSCSLYGVVAASRQRARNNGASHLLTSEGAEKRTPTSTQGGAQGRSRLGRSNSTGHSLRKEAMSRAAAVATEAAGSCAMAVPPSQSPLHRSRSAGLEEEEAMVGPEAATSDESPVSAGGHAAPSSAESIRNAL
ncbi:hypothetical protein GOP47_0007822 [Adiantum capillus-veneris]|uniref:RING-type E3 ubiquitin transferase n=1 Tax=Adiantum capillus-veneris TaxID=13818 RepID=A0A9D4V1M9_ADICA|nr:hypothetical protein GOP47_0007822 [Adiantum capillus-veneris]